MFQPWILSTKSFLVSYKESRKYIEKTNPIMIPELKPELVIRDP